MSAPSQEGLSIAVPRAGFRRFLFFNRFAVEREQGFVHIKFGNVNKANVLVDSYALVISELELAALRQSSMDYLGAQGSLQEAPPPWQPTGSMITEIANHFVMARHASIAETIFYSFSLWSAVEAAKRAASADGKKPIQELDVIAEPMALLRSPLAAQQHLIRLLFPPVEASLPGQ
jgi:hypothetical protein